MRTAKHAGRVGALAVALVLMASVVPGPAVSPAVRLSASTAPCTRTDVTCALILGGTTVPTPDSAYIDAVRNHFIAPTHPGQDIDVRPGDDARWSSGPSRGSFALSWLVLGPPSVCGTRWPGVAGRAAGGNSRACSTSPSISRSRHGVGRPGGRRWPRTPTSHLVIYGYSQGAIIANLEKRKLAEQYPAGTDAPDIDFVLSGDRQPPQRWHSLPGSRASTFRSSTVTFNGPAPTDTQFDTVEINRQYDGVRRFPVVSAQRHLHC